MFTGIIETAGKITDIVHEGTNIHFTIQSEISNELKIDQSLAHDGVCLTVIALTEDTHTVTAIHETMEKTRLAEWKVGDTVNLERAMIAGARLDGHIVQGHVDLVGECRAVEEAGGSWYYTFRYPISPEHLLVNKGSICVNGVSLTVIDPVDVEDGLSDFKVAIIPYTREHTNFSELAPGKKINLEFDIIGKYISRYNGLYG